MHFWGVTIETVSTILLLIAVGLSVDYASHVAHTFMIISGTRYGRLLTLFHYSLFTILRVKRYKLANVVYEQTLRNLPSCKFFNSCSNLLTVCSHCYHIFVWEYTGIGILQCSLISKTDISFFTRITPRGEGYSTKFFTGRLFSHFQPFTLLYTIFEIKGTPFVYPLLTMQVALLSHT